MTIARFMLPIAFTLSCGISEAVANCGPFGMFEGNDYCISCPASGATPARRWKENSCPGGETGITAEGVLHPGCSISYFGGNTCNVNYALSHEFIEQLRKEGHYKVN